MRGYNFIHFIDNQIYSYEISEDAIIFDTSFIVFKLESKQVVGLLALIMRGKSKAMLVLLLYIFAPILVGDVFHHFLLHSTDQQSVKARKIGRIQTNAIVHESIISII